MKETCTTSTGTARHVFEWGAREERVDDFFFLAGGREGAVACLGIFI